jgi:hypothetical protein
MNMTEQNKKLAEDLLIETALFYNSGNRSMNKGSCLYESEDGRKCGIGRIMTKKGISLIKGRRQNEECINVVLEYSLKQNIFLKKWEPLSAHVSFLGHIQFLHDNEDKWNKNGIAKKGIRFVKFMCEEYDLNKDRVLATIKAK